MSNSTVTYTVSGCTGGFIFWSGPSAMQVLSGGNGSSSITVKFTDAGSFGIFVGGGCTTTLNINVYDSNIIGPSSVCHSSTSVFSGATAGYNSLSWSISPNVLSKSVSGNTFTVNWANTDPTYLVTVTYQTNYSGTFSVTKSVSAENSVGAVTGPIAVFSCYSEDYGVTGTNVKWGSKNNQGVFIEGTLVGGTFMNGTGSNPMRIRWNGSVTSGSFTVRYTSPLGCAKEKTVNVTITPNVPLLKPLDSYDASQYCYKAQRTFETDQGNGSYTWTITGSSETTLNPYQITKPATDPNRHIFNVYQGTAFPHYYYGNVQISVRYTLGTCTSATRTVSMIVNPATINFRGAASAYPIICNSDRDNIGVYSTDAGFGSYVWSSPNGTPTSPNEQSTNMNWASSSSTVPISVSYFKSTLNCANYSLARIGALMRNPNISGTSPAQVNTTTPFYQTEGDGFEHSWSINGETANPNSWGSFTNPAGTLTSPIGRSETNIIWSRNNDPGPFPTVSVNYWLYYGGARISSCVASREIDLRACSTCNARQAPEIASNNELVESGIFSVFPTPADHELWLQNVPVGAGIKMVSMNGAEAISISQDQESLVKKLDTGSLPSGVYLLRTVDIDQQPVSVRVIVRH